MDGPRRMANDTPPSSGTVPPETQRPKFRRNFYRIGTGRHPPTRSTSVGIGRRSVRATTSPGSLPSRRMTWRSWRRRTRGAPWRPTLLGRGRTTKCTARGGGRAGPGKDEVVDEDKTPGSPPLPSPCSVASRSGRSGVGVHRARASEFDIAPLWKDVGCRSWSCQLRPHIGRAPRGADVSRKGIHADDRAGDTPRGTVGSASSG